MLINNKQLKKVKVETQSGQNLGQIIDFEIETDTGIIEKYYVKSKIALAGLFENKLIINREQVISFDDQKMIVEDNVIKEKVSDKESVPEVKEIEGTEPVVTSKIGD